MWGCKPNTCPCLSAGSAELAWSKATHAKALASSSDTSPDDVRWLFKRTRRALRGVGLVYRCLVTVVPERFRDPALDGFGGHMHEKEYHRVHRNSSNECLTAT